MSHPLADLILLCDLLVRHTVSAKAHIDGLSDLQTQQKLSFPHRPPCSNSTELPWVTYVSPLCGGTFLSSSLKILPSLLSPVINLANSLQASQILFRDDNLSETSPVLPRVAFLCLSDVFPEYPLLTPNVGL